jgi:hypothetical protein
MDRGQFLRLGAVGVAGSLGAGALAGTATAALPPTTPQGDDVGFLAFGAVAERTSLSWYRAALCVRGLSRRERRRLDLARKAKIAHVTRLNAVLGADAVALDDFDAEFPRGTFGSRARMLPAGERLETLLVGVYLNGAAFARDAATRLLLGRLMAYDAQQLAWLRTLARKPASSGLPIPLDLEQAGPQLDALLSTPNFSA